jgi:hypothetical protein
MYVCRFSVAVNFPFAYRAQAGTWEYCATLLDSPSTCAIRISLPVNDDEGNWAREDGNGSGVVDYTQRPILEELAREAGVNANLFYVTIDSVEKF